MSEKKIKWIPSVSLKIGLLHLWAGKETSDGRSIYLLLEEIENAVVALKIHWLTSETPMFALFLWPQPYGVLFWCGSHPVRTNDRA